MLLPADLALTPVGRWKRETSPRLRCAVPSTTHFEVASIHKLETRSLLALPSLTLRPRKPTTKQFLTDITFFAAFQTLLGS